MRRPSNSSTADAKAVEAAAVRLLARREHSTEELRRKLLAKGYRPDTIEPVILKLAGPVRSRAELRQQGIPDSQVEEALRRAEVDWVERVREVRRRKFGATPPRSLGERAKQARFLQYRGFDAEQLRAAFREESGEADGAPDITPDIY